MHNFFFIFYFFLYPFFLLSCNKETSIEKLTHAQRISNIFSAILDVTLSEKYNYFKTRSKFIELYVNNPDYQKTMLLNGSALGLTAPKELFSHEAKKLKPHELAIIMQSRVLSKVLSKEIFIGGPNEQDLFADHDYSETFKTLNKLTLPPFISWTVEILQIMQENLRINVASKALTDFIENNIELFSQSLSLSNISPEERDIIEKLVKECTHIWKQENNICQLKIAFAADLFDHDANTLNNLRKQIRSTVKRNMSVIKKLDTLSDGHYLPTIRPIHAIINEYDSSLAKNPTRNKKKKVTKETVPSSTKRNFKEETHKLEEASSANISRNIIIQDAFFGLITLLKQPSENNSSKTIPDFTYAPNVQEWFEKPQEALKKYPHYNNPNSNLYSGSTAKEKEIIAIHGFSKKLDDHIQTHAQLTEETDRQGNPIKRINMLGIATQNGKNYPVIIEYLVNGKGICFHRNCKPFGDYQEFYKTWFEQGGKLTDAPVYDKNFPTLS